MKIVSRNKSLF